MYGSSFNFVQWPPKNASFLHQSAFWPLKVVQSSVVVKDLRLKDEDKDLMSKDDDNWTRT